MGSKGRMPPPHMRRPLPGGIMHPDPFGPGIRPPGGPFPFDMMPPPEVMEQKLAAQHMEMQKLATENQRLAATHGSLRQELAAAQQELQRLQAHIDALKNDKEQHMRGLLDKIARMEVDFQSAEPLKMELQQARADAQSLNSARQELIVKVQQLSQELQRSHGDVQQIPALMSELDGLRQEYQHYRATYDYDKKLYNDHLQSLQVMEKNYVSMAREVEKLRAELANTTNLERSGVPYNAPSGYKENDDTGHHPAGQGAYEDGYGVPQARGPAPAPTPAAAAAPYGTAPSGPAPAWAGYEAPRATGYDAPPRGASYDAPPRGASYDAPQRAPTGYEAPPRGGGGYEAAPPRGGGGYEAPPRGGGGYEAPARAAGAQVMVAPGNNAPYGSVPAPPTHTGGYEAPRGGNPVRR